LLGIENQLEVVSNTVNKLHSQQRDQKRQAILDWLTLTDYSSQQSDFIKGRQEGTGNWVLESNEFREWESQNKHTLFCPGIPGAGKTMITSIVVDHLCKKFRGDLGVGIAYIYCNFRRQQDQQVIDLLLSLLKQFVQRQPSIPEGLTKLYRDHERDRSRPSVSEITSVLYSVISGYSRAFVIIDALDEVSTSSEVLSTFLTELFNLQVKTGSSLFTTSRPIQSIPNEFRRRESSTLEIRASDYDMERYLNGHMSQILPFVRETQEMEERIKRTIIEATDGMYVYLFTSNHFKEYIFINGLA
jgi:Cdc6-like AAA superfamily ATPase